MSRRWRFGIVAVSAATRRAVELVERCAALPYPVHVHGETGTGKELVARALHEAGPRRGGPFVAANASAISASLAESELFGHVRGAFTGAERDRTGLFELAHRGTLFLDEVEAMPPPLQEKLLRVLQDGEVRRVGGARSVRVDVRIVSASNERLERLGTRFRRDLLFRLNVLRIDLPPLRERPEDLPELASFLLDRMGRETGGSPRRLDDGALARLEAHDWPGNVRELESALRRAAASGSELLRADDFAFLEAGVPADPQDGPVPVDDYLRDAVERFGEQMSFTELASRLGVSRKTLWTKRKKWGLL